MVFSSRFRFEFLYQHHAATSNLDPDSNMIEINGSEKLQVLTISVIFFQELKGYGFVQNYIVYKPKMLHLKCFEKIIKCRYFTENGKHVELIRVGDSR